MRSCCILVKLFSRERNVSSAFSYRGNSGSQNAASSRDNVNEYCAETKVSWCKISSLRLKESLILKTKFSLQEPSRSSVSFNENAFYLTDKRKCSFSSVCLVRVFVDRDLQKRRSSRDNFNGYYTETKVQRCKRSRVCDWRNL